MCDGSDKKLSNKIVLRNFGQALATTIVIAHYNYIRSCVLSEGHGGHPQHPLKLTQNTSDEQNKYPYRAV